MTRPLSLPRLASLTYALVGAAEEADKAVLGAINAVNTASRPAALKPVIAALVEAVDAATEIQCYVDEHPELHP